MTICLWGVLIKAELPIVLGTKVEKEVPRGRILKEIVNSPPSNEQDNYVSANNQFPQSKEEFKAYLRSIPFDQKVREFRMAQLDFWQAVNEWQHLPFDPVYHGDGIPKGDGKRVIIITGFATFEWQYSRPISCLKKMNYEAQTYPLRFGTNVEPIENMIEKYVQFLVEQKRVSGRKVGVVGHSKGGLLTAAAYVLYRQEFLDSVDKVFFVGSPVPEWVNSAIAELYLFFQDLLGGDDFKLTETISDLESLKREKDLEVTSISPVNDRIIQGPLIGAPSDHFHVDGSHSGLLVNSRVLRIIGERLSQNLAAAA